MCHSQLPMVAVVDSERPAVHIWHCGGGTLRELGVVGPESRAGGKALFHERMDRTPALAWHPEQPFLLIAGETGVVRWSADGLADDDALPSTACYRSIAFSPDGQTVWAHPSSRGGDDGWRSSDVVDLATGSVSAGWQWDTGVAAHPAGGLVVTLQSDQGATLGLFARIDREITPTPMRLLRRALILEGDGYQAPVFSVDGRHLAIRGNAYENLLEVFEFPTLRRVLRTTLGDPNPGYPYSSEWLEQYRAWSRQNAAFGAEPGVLWLGTPSGTVLEIGVDDQRVVEHDVLGDSPVTGLCALSSGDLVVAGGAGELALVSVRTDAASATPDRGAMRDAVTAFVDAVSEVPDDDALWDQLVMTDGTREWAPNDLATPFTATTTSPAWRQLQAVLNTRRHDA
ncbi:hypothetical protein SAMN04489732_10187 [Amycolatopsis saalfeldensis]|uniref:WD40-like Beta Propeller Repeat n=1 Tax=Amycolatopsis saalfeldensis TaxID=394193 RepID=A0A1H8PVW5_9PSEU|nr:hypothetical protein SAMN04489732_10187 [Amycolatopsis saalfeldensis]